MALTLIILVALACAVVAWFVADGFVRRQDARVLAAMVVDPLVDHMPRESCWMCDPAADRYDGRACPTCHLLNEVTPDRPIPFSLTEEPPPWH
ncbi:hypothetical protein [Embleya hyalina]|uniref:Uncharacterized protein n=1 Tax=Embleya hyalina TaxID=516124 RepID=A0A401YHG9_9ACTN|nr:hypothetical protein [Embleya hyalina]GCD94051.1 hypothetical protein EHYA_01707 [Embleya hyalina]